jgi:hypothetical protein
MSTLIIETRNFFNKKLKYTNAGPQSYCRQYENKLMLVIICFIRRASQIQGLL